MDRLEQAATLGRRLFDHGIATLDGSQVRARELPLSPLPDVPPRLLRGGGSGRLLDIAGRYADVLDLNGSSRSTPVAGTDLPTADTRRELATTVQHLEESIKRVRAAAQPAGRPATAVQLSHMLNYLTFCAYVTFCANAQVGDAARVFTAAAGLDEMSLDDCPYVLVGEPERMRDAVCERRERLNVHAVLLGQGQGWPTVERLCCDVCCRTSIDRRTMRRFKRPCWRPEPDCT